MADDSTRAHRFQQNRTLDYLREHASLRGICAICYRAASDGDWPPCAVADYRVKLPVIQVIRRLFGTDNLPPRMKNDATPGNSGIVIVSSEPLFGPVSNRNSRQTSVGDAKRLGSIAAPRRIVAAVRLHQSQ